MKEITRRDIRKRLQDYPYANYTTVSSVIKGVALANAAIVIGPILKHDNITSALFWLAGFIGVVVTSQATMFGIVIVAWHKFRYTETILTFLIGISEFGLFSLSVSQTLGPWLLCFAVFSAVGGVLAYNAAVNAKPSRYEPDVRSAVLMYSDSQKKTAMIALSSSIVWSMVTILLWSHNTQSSLAYLISGAAVFNITGAMLHQHWYTRRLVIRLTNDTEMQS
jgi:hypothetical protein